MSDEAKEGETDAQSSRAVLTSGGQREAQVYATAELRDVHRPTLEMDKVQITDPRRAVTQKSVRPPMPDLPPPPVLPQTPPPPSAHPKPLFAEPILAAKAFATPPPPSVRAGGAIGALPPPSAPPRKLAAPPATNIGPTNLGGVTPPPLPVTPPPLPAVTPPPLPAASVAAPVPAPKSVRTPTTTAPAVPSALAKPAPDPDDDIPDRPTLPRTASGELPVINAAIVEAPPNSAQTPAHPSDPPGGVAASPIPVPQAPTEAPRRRSGAVYVGIAAIALLGAGGAWLALGSRGNTAPIAAATSTPSVAAAPIETAAPVATAAPARIETAAPAPIETAAPAQTAAPAPIETAAPVAATPPKPAPIEQVARAPVAAKAPPPPPAAKPEPKAAPPPPPAAKPEKPAGKRTLFDVEQ